jgi:DNA ligase (NAD+)
MSAKRARAKRAGRKLSGKAVVLTGALESMTREEAREAITQAGGRVTSSVSSKTDLVVVGRDPGSKHEKAKKLGIETINEEGLRRLLGL